MPETGSRKLPSEAAFPQKQREEGAKHLAGSCACNPTADRHPQGDPPKQKRAESQECKQLRCFWIDGEAKRPPILHPWQQVASVRKQAPE